MTFGSLLLRGTHELNGWIVWLLETKEYFTIGEDTIRLGLVFNMLLRPERHRDYSPRLPVLGCLVRKFVFKFIAGLKNEGDLVLLISVLYLITGAGLSIGLTGLLIGGLWVLGCLSIIL